MTPNAVNAKRQLPGKHPTCCNGDLERITWDGEKWVFLTEYRIDFCPWCGSRLDEELIPYG